MYLNGFFRDINNKHRALYHAADAVNAIVILTEIEAVTALTRRENPSANVRVSFGSR